MRTHVLADRVAAVAALSEALGPVDFPITKREAVRRVRGWDVQLTDDAAIPLADLVEALPEEALSNYATAVKTLDRQWGRVAQTLVEIEEAQRHDRP
jgi:hypothetical protein